MGTNQWRGARALFACACALLLAACAARVTSEAAPTLAAPAEGKAILIFRVGYSYASASAEIRPTDLFYEIEGSGTAFKRRISVKENVPLVSVPEVAGPLPAAFTQSALVVAELPPGRYEIGGAVMPVSPYRCRLALSGRESRSANPLFQVSYRHPVTLELAPGAVVYAGYLHVHARNDEAAIGHCGAGATMGAVVSLRDAWAEDAAVLARIAPHIDAQKVARRIAASPDIGAATLQ